MKKRSILIFLLALVLTASLGLPLTGCGDSGDSQVDGDTDGDVETDPNPLPFQPAGPDAAPDPMEMGPFPVGVKTIDFVDNSRIYPNNLAEEYKDWEGKPRTLRTEIWYPATQEFKDGPFYALDMREEAAGAPLGDKKDIIVNSDIAPIETQSIRDADIDRAHGPYPIIFFSHGCNGIRWQSIFYTIHLASHGYIVISTDHEMNTLWEIIRLGWEQTSLIKSLDKRPADMTFLLDRFLEKNQDSEDFFYQTMIPEDVGITGHSLGGITASLMPCKDPRFKVVVNHSPAFSVGQLIGECDPDWYPVPIMTMGGTMDKTLTWCGQYCEYRDMVITDQPHYLYELIGGGHFTFSDICRLDLVKMTDELGMGSAAEDALEDGCATYNVDYKIAFKSIDYYATAFFNQFLRHSPASEDYLVEKSEAPFDVVNFYEGDISSSQEIDKPADYCDECNGL